MDEAQKDFYLRHEKELGYIELTVYELQCMIEEQGYNIRKLIDGEKESEVRLWHPNIILGKYLDVGTQMRQYLIKEKHIDEP